MQTIISAAAQGEDIQEQAGKQLLVLLLDTLEKIILANAFQVQAIAAGSPSPENVATGGLAGIAKGAILAAIVKGLFGAAKAALTANYQGDPYVGGDVLSLRLVKVIEHLSYPLAFLKVFFQPLE